MSLEQQLKQSGEKWLGQEELSPANSARLTNLVRQRSRRRSLQRWGATAAAGLVLVASGGFYGPAIASYASDLPWVGGYIQRLVGQEDGLVWAEGHGYVVPVGESVTKDGYTFTVDSVLADGARTEVFWSMSGPELAKVVRFRLDPTFNGQSVGGWSTHFEMKDGRLIGRASLPPLPHSVARVGLQIEEINGVEGDWSVGFTASRRELDPMTQVIAVDAPLQGEGYDLRVTDFRLTPTGATVTVAGEADPGFEIHGATLGTESTRGTASFDYTGLRPEISYTFQFDRLDQVPDSLNFQLTDLTQWRAGGPVLPLTPGAEVTWQGTIYTLDSVNVNEGQTEVALRITTPDGAKPIEGPRWSLRIREGLTIRPDSTSLGAKAPFEMKLRFAGEYREALDLVATMYPDPLPPPAPILIPLQ